ncbi:MAG: class I SAM-dependent methyltransferase [Desulfitobacteriaceae bacterium]|nr:class I SAM-dependent methyltransferase [Desulfitobacteriaceae bacterium]
MFTGNTALNYDSWYETKRGRFIDLVESEAAFDLITLPPGAKILDAGCGTGNFSIKLAEHGYRVTGIDLSSDMLNTARKKCMAKGLKVDLQTMNIEHLLFPDNYFDAAFSMAAFEFIADPKPAYRELYRVVKPGGQILIGTINRDSLWGKTYMEEASKNADSVFKHAYFKNLEELADVDRINLKASRQCLYVPPQAPEEHFNLEHENRLAAEYSGGFIICLWQKPY